MARIRVTIGDDEFDAELQSEESPETVSRILDALPIEANANQWGDEFYFEIPVEMEPENARPKVGKGDLAFWPAGNCFCIFFGPTPMSTSPDEIVPASPVNVVGAITDPDRLKQHSGGERVRIVRAD
jgi:hypothetical protein